jgi:hypothetical protein
VRHADRRARERGIALVLVLALVTMGALFMLVNQLKRAAHRIDRDLVTTSALAEAKQALIGYAARDRRLRPLTPTNATPPYYSTATIAAYGTSGLNVEQNDRPGSLPCPAADEDGIALPADACASWSTAGGGGWKNRVGWLPWRTLGIPPLRDADGNLLWYAVSDSFRNGSDNQASPRPLVINSDTPHWTNTDPTAPYAFRPLTVQGTVPATAVVAVVIAPGQPLSGQDRAGARFSVRSWLEGGNNYLDNDVGAASDDVFEMQLTSPTFNDTLASLTAAELFSVVENAVALRAQRTIVPLVQDYYTDWSALPYPATFDADRCRPAPPPCLYPDFIGSVPGTLPVTSVSVIAGQLPLPRTDDVTWGAITIKQLVNPADSDFDPAIHEADTSIPLWQGPYYGHVVRFSGSSTSACTPSVVANAADPLNCTVYYTGRPWVKISGAIPIGARGLVKTQLNYVSPTPVTDTLSGTAAQDGSTTMIYVARLTNFTGGTSTVISTALQFEAVPTITLDSPSGNTAWFVRNEWYRLMQYAVAPGAAPGKPTSGPGAIANCTSGATATCLRARHANGTVEFSRAVLVLAGAKSYKAGSAAQLRQDDAGAVTTDPANYFEAGNLSADLQYEEQRRASQPATAFNDRLAGYKAP